MQRLAVGSLLLTSFLLAGCSNAGDDEHAEHTESFDVAIHGSQFDPRTLSMPAGHTLRFENHDTFSHTATVVNGLNSGDIAPNGGGHEFNDMQAGTYTFTCKYHGAMRLTVNVMAA